MAEKTGAGGKPQEYDENSGRYGGSGGDIRKAVDNYKPNDLKSTVDRYRELERKYNDDLTAEPPKLNRKKIKQLDYYEDERKGIAQISDLTGYDTRQAKKAYDAIKHYTTAGFKKIRKDKNGIEAQIIEDFILRHPKYDGEIYRGIAFYNQDGKDFLDSLNYSFSHNQQIDMNGISSWSGARSVAEDFANNRNVANDSYRFIFKANNKYGVGIDHLSRWHGEEEVIQSGNAKYKVLNIEQKEKGLSPLYEIEIEEIERR